MSQTVSGGPETMLPSDDARICAQAFGWPSDPAILLIMGQMASMLWWPDAFCERLARAGRFVIRYDNRDTGLSTSYEPGGRPTRSTIWRVTRSPCSTGTASSGRVSWPCRWAA